MNAERTPMRWPGSWKSPSTIGLLKGTPINWLLVDPDAGLGPVIEEAKRAGFEVADITSPPAGVDLIAGEWPGVAMSRGGDGLLRLGHAHGEIETKAYGAFSREEEALGDARVQLVGGHQFDGGWLENAGAIELAGVEQH